MTTKRDLRRRVDALNAELEPQPGLITFVSAFTPDDPLPGAFSAAHEARNPYGGEIVIVLGEDVEAFRDRLDETLRSLAVDAGVDIGHESYCAYLAGRREGEIDAGDQGVTEHFDGEVTTTHVDRVFRELVEAGPLIIHDVFEA